MEVYFEIRKVHEETVIFNYLFTFGPKSFLDLVQFKHYKAIIVLFGQFLPLPL